MSTAREFRRFFLIAIILLSYSIVSAQVRIKERVEIKPLVKLDNQLLMNTARVISYPYFTKEDFWYMWCVKADFPIVGYKTKIKWSIDIHSECGEGDCCGGEFSFFLYPYGPEYDYIYLDRCQSATLTGSAEMDKDYYAWSGTFIGFAVSKNTKPIDVTVNATGDTAVYYFSKTDGAKIQGTVELTAENPWASLCPVLILSKREINPGDTVMISVMGKDTLGNLTSYPTKPPYYAEQNFDYTILSGGEYGRFVYVENCPGRCFVADTLIQADTARVVIRARFSGCDFDWGTCGPAIDTITIKKLDHFKVTIVPDTAAIADTVAFAEGAKLIVQAQNKDSVDIEYDGNTKLKFLIATNEAYGTLINANGDTLKTTPVQLSDILYKDANQGKIKFAAVKKNPESFAVCRIRVEKQSDATKYGERDAIVVEQTLKIVMEAPYQVRPSIPTEDNTPFRIEQRKKAFEVKMTRGGKSVANHPFKLWTDYVVGSGGHNHGDTRDISRVDNDDNYGYFLVGQATQHRRPLEDITNAEGKFAVKYNASIFGDSMKIYLKSRSKSLLLDSISIMEKVDSLINFRNVTSNSQWTFSQSAQGATRHPDNNWCIHKMSDSFQRAIRKFYEWSQDTLANPFVLSLNDMSLRFGGRFDISGRWDGRNSQAHLYHRTGTSVDINDPNNRIKIDDGSRHGKWTAIGEKLIDIFDVYGASPENERPIHFEFHY